MENVSGVWAMEKKPTKTVWLFFSAHSFCRCLLMLVDGFTNSSDFAMWFYANSCRNGGGLIISIKIKPFHAGSAPLCGVSWFWDVQNMNSSWSAFQCVCAASWGRIVESRLQFIDLHIQPQKVDLSTFFLPWAVSKHCCRGFITYASSTESLCKMHSPLSSSSCWELLSRPVFSKRTGQKSYRLQCAVVATVFETSWLKGWIVCSERWPLHLLDNGI